MRRPSRTILAVGVALALAACGGGDDTAEDDGTAAAPAAGEVTFAGTEAIAWGQTEVSAEAVDGELDVTIVCEGAVTHNLVIEGVQGEAELVACEGDDEASTTIAIEPGTYDFWCSIPGHREAGMEGVLTVTS
jgi:uncharacterized cupredoxin-like copper-binding protein